MANPEHLAKLNQGVVAWNRWREQNPGVTPEIEGATLAGATLARANLAGADIAGANLTGADLAGADLTGANLLRANLFRADLPATNLSKANLSHAILAYTTLLRAGLTDTTLDHSYFDNTVVSICDLSATIGLHRVVHRGPSCVDYHTLVMSKGEIPEEFLIGTGFPESQVKNILATVKALSPIEFHSAFISHSSKDEAFVKRLHSRLRDANVRTWYAPEDLRGGKETEHQIDQAIRIHDKLLLVLSKRSMESDWVQHEIYKALKYEKQTGKQKLFPISLVPFTRVREWQCFDPDSGKDMAKVVRRYHIPDFRIWKTDHDKFEAEFAKLLEALQRDDEAADQS